MARVSAGSYYDILQLNPRTACHKKIKEQFYKLSFLHHPDRNRQNPQHSAKQFQRIAEAYSVLGNPAKKSEYDRRFPTRTARARNTSAQNMHSGMYRSSMRENLNKSTKPPKYNHKMHFQQHYSQERPSRMEAGQTDRSSVRAIMLAAVAIYAVGIGIFGH